MKQNTLYWHDYETWGAIPAIDRPCQFAGMRTNLDLEPVGEPDVWFCKPTPDVLPNPEAVIVTGITPDYAEKYGLTEPEFVKNIHGVLSEPNTCSVGYNSIRFDDEVSRYALYRNFYDPYAREWQNGNSRWDIIDMLRTCYALRPDGIEWPVHDGRISFKLEALAQANGLMHTKAHDALSDVEVTIELAKLIKKKQPQLYDHLFNLRLKNNVADAISVKTRKPFLHISSRFPVENGCAGLVVPLAYHPKNKNAVIVFNLDSNPKELFDLSAEQIADRVFIATNDLAEGVERLNLKAVHINKSPVVLTPKFLTADIAKRLNIDIARCERHWQQILTMDISDKIAHVFALNQFDTKPDAEQQLYDGFLPPADKPLLEHVRRATGPQLKAGGFRFNDQRYNALMLRYKGRFFPEILTADERVEWAEICRSRWFEGVDGYLTLAQFELRIQELSLARPDKLEQLCLTQSWAKNKILQANKVN